MNLKDFIEETLVEITHGITGANNQLAPEGGGIGSTYLLKNSNTDKNSGYIEFDVAITIKNNVEAKAKGKFALFVADAEMSAQGAHSNENISRVKFKVATTQPVGNIYNSKDGQE